MNQKFIMEFFSVLFLSLSIGTSFPAAVSEDLNEPSISNPISNISSSQKDMQRYIQDLRKQKASDTVTMKKYIKAYSVSHENYQQSEEKESDKIAKQNNDTIRLHPELIQFEITDAKVPDNETLKLIEQGKERKMADVLIDKKVLVKKDVSTAESIMLRITHPGPVPMSNRPRSIQELPREVQNAINYLVQKDNSQKLLPHKSDNFKYFNTNMYYGDKVISQDTSKNWWSPVKIFQKSATAPLVHNSQLLNNFKPVPSYTYPKQSSLLHTVPKIYLDKYQTEPKETHSDLAQIEAVKPVNLLYAYKTDYPVFLPQNGKTNVQTATSDKLITNGDQNLIELNSLIGKSPDVQLKGLGEILEQQDIYITEKPIIRPQDSTAPVLFPLGARLPKPRSTTDKSIFVVNAITYATPKTPEATTAKSYTYGDVNNYYKNTHLLSSPYFKTKDHIPISENTPDTSPDKLIIQVTPHPSHVYVAPMLEKEKQKKKFVESLDDNSDLQYASGYAFGYRVRDSHTGNDYGHTQNRATDGVTRGEYHIRLPDGRIQNVKYTADEKGFHADVSYQSGN